MIAVVCGGCGCEEGKQLEEDLEEIQMDDDVVEGQACMGLSVCTGRNGGQ